MNPKISDAFQKFQRTIFAYPMVVLMSALMSCIFVFLVDNEDIKRETKFVLSKLGVVFALGISLMFAVKILSQRSGKSLILHVVGLLVLAGFYFVLPQKEADFNEVYVFLLIPAYVLSHLLVAFIAFLKKENTEKSFWQYNKNLFVNIVLTAIFTGVLVGGIELAVFAVDRLFDLNIKDTIYIQTFLGLSIFGSTIIFLLFSATGLDYLETEDEYPVILKFFTQFILIPLLFIYVFILYIYSLKILVNWELPRGWVSYMILAYSVVGILALLLVYPLREASSKSWVRIFGKLFYYTLLPLLVLLFTALFTRVLAYGFTEARYFLLILAIWLSCLVVYFILKKDASIKFIPVSLFLFGLFSLITPYFNTFSVSKRSQKNELLQILSKNHLLINGKIDFNKQVSDSVVYSINSKFNYLDSRFQKDFLMGLLDKTSQKDIPEGSSWDLIFKFKNLTKTEMAHQTDRLQLRSETSVYPVSGYQFVNFQMSLTDREIKVNNDVFKLHHKGSGTVELLLNQQQKVDLIPLIDALFEKHNGLATKKEVDDLYIEFDLGSYHIKMLFGSINKSNSNSGSPNYWFEEVLILFNQKTI